MALVKYRSADCGLEDLQSQFSDLDSELVVIKKCCSDLKKEHGSKCSNALKDAVSSLLQVVNYVNKSDKSLIYWFEKGPGMKRALRCEGIDKRTAAMVEKKSRKITGEAAKVESQFNRSGQVFSDGLKAAQNLNTRVTEYSLSSIGDARQQAATMYDEADGNAQSVQVKLTKSKTDCEKIREDINAIPQQISGVESSRRTAQQSSSSSSDVKALSNFPNSSRPNLTDSKQAAVASFAVAGVATVASFFCPPVALFAMSAAAVSAGSAISSRCSTSSPCGRIF